MQFEYDVAVLGGGPGGYIAAIRTAQLGSKTVLIEKEDLGGTCLNRGCIPTKALLHSAEVYHKVKTASEFGITSGEAGFDFYRIMSRKDSVVEKLRNGIQVLIKGGGIRLEKGTGILIDKNTITIDGKRNVTANSIIIATGSKPAKISIPGSELTLSSDDVLQLKSCPESVVIIGGGVIGIEFATLFNTLGKKVTIVEMLPQILPGMDTEIAALMKKSLKKKKIDINTNAKVLKIEKTSSGILCHFEKEGKELITEGEICVMAVGRKPQTEEIGLENIGVNTQKGFVLADATMRTNIGNVFAIGDITGKMQLAHVASAQGIVAAHNVAGQKKTMQYNIIPACIYTSPEVASVGLTENDALAKGYKIKIGRFNIAANGKSMILGETEGLSKIITDEKTGEILGAHILAAHATDMISEISVAMKAEATIEELIDTIHPHPTVNEIIMEAAHDVEGLCCHKLK